MTRCRRDQMRSDGMRLDEERMKRKANKQIKQRKKQRKNEIKERLRNEKRPS